MIENILTLVLLGIVAFIQNMMFTLVSRSRNSGDPKYHRFCAWGSNGVWIVCFLLVMKTVWASIENGNWLYVAMAILIYTLATTEGSVWMMKRMIRSESGKRKVGATGGDTDPDKLLARIIRMEEKQDAADSYNAKIDIANKRVTLDNKAAHEEDDGILVRLDKLESRKSSMTDRLNSAKIATLKAITERLANLESNIKNIMDQFSAVEGDLYDIKQGTGAKNVMAEADTEQYELSLVKDSDICENAEDDIEGNDC